MIKMPVSSINKGSSGKSSPKEGVIFNSVDKGRSRIISQKSVSV